MAVDALGQRAVISDWKTFCTERDRLIDAHAPANFRGLSDNDTSTVVDEKALVDFRPGMNVDSGRRMGEFCNDSCEQGRAEKIKFVRQVMMRHAGDTWIAEAHFLETLRGGISMVGGMNIGLEQCAHSRQARSEFSRNVKRPTSAFVGGQV